MLSNIEKLQQKLLSKVVAGPNGCWIFIGAKINTGYGIMTFLTYNILAHRASWMAFKGTNPGDLFILHKCDNRACINPDHLFIGDDQDNSNDKCSKGRHCHGDTHGRRKLTSKDVMEIKSKLAFGQHPVDIGAQFGISERTIRNIRDGDTWRHV